MTGKRKAGVIPKDKFAKKVLEEKSVRYGNEMEDEDDWTAKVIWEMERKILVSYGMRKTSKESWRWNEELQECVTKERFAKKNMNS